MRILVTTDNHVGYNEHDPLRGEDAALTFDEIMTIAQEKDVDFVLQGGDLFHINKPSKRSMYQVIKTLRKRCLSDKPIEFELLHHGQLNLDSELDHPNFDDPNLNVGIPVFAISGNHDDRGGAVLLSPLDVLACSGLINYFGRVLDNDSIEVVPLLIRKNNVKVAIYGISNVRDERLHRAFRNKQVKFLTTPDQDSYFNILMVHQNRNAHSETNYLPTRFLPHFFNLVIWGHEHECLIDPERDPITGFEVIQPGSSVATSLCEGEAVRKYVGILDIKSAKSYDLEKIPLKTVRPFKMRTVSIRDDSNIKPSKNHTEKVSGWMRAEVETLISEAISEWKVTNGESDEEPPLPLIRLRVDYSGGYEVENPTRFSNKFSGRVANQNDVVQYMKRRQPNEKTSTTSNINVTPDVSTDTTEKVQLSELVHQFLQKQMLQVIPEKGMSYAISKFVDQDDKAAVKEFVDTTLTSNVSSIAGTGEKIGGIQSAPIVLSDEDQSANTTRADVTMATDSEDDIIAHDLAALGPKKRTSKKILDNSCSEEEDSDDMEIDSDSEEEPTPPPPTKPKKAAAAPKKPATKPKAAPKPKTAPQPRKARTTKASTPNKKPAASKGKTPNAPIVLDVPDSDDGFD